MVLQVNRPYPYYFSEKSQVLFKTGHKNKLYLMLGPFKFVNYAILRDAN